MRIRVDNKLRIASEWLTSKMTKDLILSMRVKNPERVKAARAMVRGWEKMPEWIELATGHDYYRDLLLPRGVAHQLVRQFDHNILWEDNRTDAFTDQLGSDRSLPLPQLRDYQEEAVQALVSAEQGVYEAPTGSGKTIVGAALIRELQRRAIVIVGKRSVADQWMKLFLPSEVGLFGDGEADLNKPVVVALQQTLWSRRDQLGAKFWKSFGLVILDECHHVPAHTFYDVFQRFHARYRLGFSATPERNPELVPFVEAAIGPVVHSTDEKALTDAKLLLIPSVSFVETGFSFDYYPTHPANKCAHHPACKQTKNGIHRNNWQDLIEALVNDSSRAEQVATEAWFSAEQNHSVLVLSRRLAHFDAINSWIPKSGRSDVLFFTGRESQEEQQRVRDRVDEGTCIVFSTLADEALDIPRFDKLLLPFPGRNPEVLKQQVGRIRRPHPHKHNAQIVDFTDSLVGILRSQYVSRLNGYRRMGFCPIYANGKKI